MQDMPARRQAQQAHAPSAHQATPTPLQHCTPTAPHTLRVVHLHLYASLYVCMAMPLRPKHVNAIA